MTPAPFEDRIAALMANADVVRPAGPGPHPAVIQLHGCGGRKPYMRTWAQAAAAAGWASISVDSYAFRRITRFEAYLTVCTGARLWGRERAGDLYAALEWVRRQPWADPGRMVAAGWSHGGWTVLDAMALRPGADMAAATGLAGLPDAPLAGVTGAFLVYPFAGPGCLAVRRGLSVRTPTEAIVGGADSIVGGASLAARLEAIPTPAGPIRVELYPRATHAFDEPESTDMRVRFDPELVARAHQQFQTFLKAAATRKAA